jgi:hypothetical protein
VGDWHHPKGDFTVISSLLGVYHLWDGFNLEN